MKDLPLNKVLCGDCREVMKTFPEESIDLVVTSPPYWGLRDYGEETVRVWGGEPDCEHEWTDVLKHRSAGGPQVPQTINPRNISVAKAQRDTVSNICHRCGAWRGSLGLEPHPQMFIDHLTEICTEVKRILKQSGSFWLNLGDTYYGSGGKGGQYDKFMPDKGQPEHYRQSSKTRSNWLHPKQLLGMPWRVAISLQEQGWTLRNCVIWHKPNHMPSSVKDRLTPSYEFFFFFVKARKYFFDLDSIREPYSDVTIARITQPNVMNQKGGDKQRELRGEGGGNASRNADMVKSLARKLTKHDLAVSREDRSYTDPLHERAYDLKGKNPGDLWTIATHPFPDAHFATFPMKLIEPIVKAASPLKVCPTCGHIRTLQWETSPPEGGYVFKRNVGGRTDGYASSLGKPSEIQANREFKGYSDCGCGAGFSPGVVLDPFCGSGTALRVARKFGRSFIGIDVKEEYCEMAKRRVKKDRYRPIPDDVVPLSEFQGNETSDVGVPPKEVTK